MNRDQESNFSTNRHPARKASDESLTHNMTDTRRSSASNYSGQTMVPERPAEQTEHHKRWRPVLAMIAGVFQQALCWGLIMTYGTILAFYTRHLIPDTSKQLVALAGAIPPFCLLLLALLWGRLLDAGHHRGLNIFAGFMVTSGMLCLTFAGRRQYKTGHYWAIVLASVPMGIGQSIYFLSAPHMARTWYPRRKGLAMGVTNSGAAIGGVIWPLIFDEVVAKHGYRVGVGVLAGIVGTLGLFIASFSVPSPSFRPNLLKGRQWHVGAWVPLRAFQSWTFRIHVLAMCANYLGILTISFFVESWAKTRGIGLSEAVRAGNGIDLQRHNRKLEVYLIVAMNACQLPGRLLGSTLCDYVRARKLHAAANAAAVSLIGAFWFLNVTRFSLGITFATLYGLTLGVISSLPINDAADMLGDKRIHLLGQYAGAVYMCSSPFVLGGAVISGVLAEKDTTDFAPGIWAICSLALSAMLIVVTLVMQDDTHKFGGAENEEAGGKAVNGEGAQASDEETGVNM